jgi:carbon storage regulator
MLVLSRRQGESVMIGDGIRITVVSLYGDRIRVGIEAPREVPVHRGEIHEMLERERAADAAGSRAAGTGEPAAVAPAAGSLSVGGSESRRTGMGAAAAAPAGRQQESTESSTGPDLLRSLRGRLQSIWQRVASRGQPPGRSPTGIPPEDLFFG